MLNLANDLRQLPIYWYRMARARGGMEGTVHKHAYGPHRRQYYLLLEPAGARPTDARPWAFYFHGGAWTFGTPEAFRPAATPWLEAGFRVVLPSYRRPPRYRMPKIVADCRAVIADVARLAEATGRPLGERIEVAGISAGGQLAALTALRPDWWTANGWPAGPGKCLCFAAPLDLLHLRPRRLFKDYAQLNPAELLRTTELRGAREWLFLHGDQDGMVDRIHTQTFAGLLQKTDGARICEYRIKGGGHLDAGRWSYDAHDPYRTIVRDFIAGGS